MGKLNEQQVDKLEDSGRISKEEANNAKKQGLDQSKRMDEFVNKFNKLVEEYGTERPGA